MYYANCFSIREFILEMAGRNVNLTAETKITVQCTWLNVLFVLHVPQLFDEESPNIFIFSGVVSWSCIVSRASPLRDIKLTFACIFQFTCIFQIMHRVVFFSNGLMICESNCQLEQVSVGLIFLTGTGICQVKIHMIQNIYKGNIHTYTYLHYEIAALSGKVQYVYT